jgi:hypothetical protein
MVVFLLWLFVPHDIRPPQSIHQCAGLIERLAMFKGDFVVTGPELLPGHSNYLKISDAILHWIVAVEVTGTSLHNGGGGSW